VGRGGPLRALKLDRRLQELAAADVGATARGCRPAAPGRRASPGHGSRRSWQPAPQTWRDAQAAIEQKQARPCDEAATLLNQLRDLAVFQDRLPEFQARLTALQAQYAHRPALQERLHNAGLV
jgi:hypothetical protein